MTKLSYQGWRMTGTCEGGHEPFKVLYFQISDVMTKGKVQRKRKTNTNDR